MMDDFLLVVPFLGDFYISFRTGAYSPIWSNHPVPSKPPGSSVSSARPVIYDLDKSLPV